MPNYRQILTEAIAENPNDTKWVKSPYGGIKLVSNTAVGKVGQSFIKKLCDYLNLPNECPKNKDGDDAYTSPWDLKINGITFEIKTASEDVNGGFQFNHVRLHRKYQAVICLGITPDKILFNIWTKADVATGIAGNLVSMEKGGASDFKLSKRPKDMLPIKAFKGRIKHMTKTISSAK